MYESTAESTAGIMQIEDDDECFIHIKRRGQHYIFKGPRYRFGLAVIEAAKMMIREDLDFCQYDFDLVCEIIGNEIDHGETWRPYNPDSED